MSIKLGSETDTMAKMARVRVLGVHPVTESSEPCYLVEIVVQDADRFEIGDITQESTTEPRSNWQVPYDERVLPPTSLAHVDDPWTRYAFFFHFLDLDHPLLTPVGPVDLPEPSPRPERLDFIRYEAP